MTADMRHELKATVVLLGQRIGDLIYSALSEGSIQASEEVVFKWKLDEFEYSEGGVTKSRAHGEHLSKESWFKACQVIHEQIKQAKEHASLCHLVEVVCDAPNFHEHAINSLVQKLISKRLHDGQLTDETLASIAATFLKDICQEPVKYGVEVDLDGIVVLPGELTFSIGGTSICLRQTRVEDLEREFPLYGMRPNYSLTPPLQFLPLNCWRVALATFRIRLIRQSRFYGFSRLAVSSTTATACIQTL